MLCGVPGFDNYPAYVLHIDSDGHKEVLCHVSAADDGEVIVLNSHATFIMFMLLSGSLYYTAISPFQQSSLL